MYVLTERCNPLSEYWKQAYPELESNKKWSKYGIQCHRGPSFQKSFMGNACITGLTALQGNIRIVNCTIPMQLFGVNHQDTDSFLFLFWEYISPFISGFE